MSGTFEDIHVPESLISFAVTTDDSGKSDFAKDSRAERGHRSCGLDRGGEDGLPTAESL